MTQPPSDGFRSPAGPRRVPPGWRLVRLADVVSEAQGGFASGERDPNGVVQLRMNNVTSRGSLDWSSVLRVPADSRTVERYKLQPGDVLFNNTNSTELVGKSALVVDHDEPVTFSNHFTRLRTIRGLLCPEYLVLWLRAQWQRGLFAAICNRWIGQSAVQRDRLLSLELPLPLLPEQQRIARLVTEQMTAVERARAAAEAQLEAAKAFKRACFRAAFESDATRDWDRVRLGDLALSIQNGVYKAADYYGHGKPLLRMYNLQKDSWLLDLDRLALAELSAAEAATFQVMPGDLLVSRVNSFELVGKCSLVDQLSAGFAFENMLTRVRLHERVEPLFIVQQMSTDHIRRQIGEVAKRAIGQASINSDDIRQLQLLLPSLSAQRQIASDLARRTSAADGFKERLEMECELIAKLPAALLRRAFSGEL